MDVVGVQVPLGVYPGGQFMAMTPTGQQVVVQVPMGAAAGSIIHVRVPAATGPPPMPMAMTRAPEPSASDDDMELAEVSVAPAFKTSMADAPDPKDLRPCMACCCTILSCYVAFPQCIGCYSKGVFTCIETESVACKPSVVEGSLCKLLSSEVELVKPVTCVKCAAQECCIDSRCALPCDSEVPCMISFLGLTIAKDYQPKCACGESASAVELNKASE